MLFELLMEFDDTFTSLHQIDSGTFVGDNCRKSESKGYVRFMLTVSKAGFIYVKNATYGNFDSVFTLNTVQRTAVEFEVFSRRKRIAEFMANECVVNIFLV